MFFSSFNRKYLKLIKMDISVFKFKLFIYSHGGTLGWAFSLHFGRYFELTIIELEMGEEHGNRLDHAKWGYLELFAEIRVLAL